MPTITIITATFNAGQKLPGLIESLRRQSCRDFEWIVIDGASNDSTVAQLESAADVVTQWLSEPDKGVYDALNKAIGRMQSDYYLVLGADDRLFPDAVAVFAEAAREGRFDLITAPVQTAAGVTRPGGGRFRSGPPLVSAHAVGTAIRKALHVRFGRYSLQYPIAADTHFLRKAVRGGVQVRFLEPVVGEFGDGGLSSRDRLWTLTDSFRANIAAGESLLIQSLLFMLRLLKNARRIRQERSVS